MKFWGRLRLASRLVRGDPVAYRITVRDCGFDLRDTPRAVLHECAVFGLTCPLAVKDSRCAVNRTAGVQLSMGQRREDIT
jgi:hypothetical protein